MAHSITIAIIDCDYHEKSLMWQQKLLKWLFLEKRGNKYSLLWKIQGPNFIPAPSPKKEVTLMYFFSVPLLEDVLSYMENK